VLRLYFEYWVKMQPQGPRLGTDAPPFGMKRHKSVLTVMPNSHNLLTIKSASPTGSKKIKEQGRFAALFLLAKDPAPKRQKGPRHLPK
jgi:hypothetical protein